MPESLPDVPPVPELPGIMSAVEVAATASAIADWQLPNGMIPWTPGGHCDPWNHVEAAMALAIAGFRAEAELAFDWLTSVQRPDGAWHQYYLADRIEQDKLDANVCAYVAAGVWHHWLMFADRGFVEALWPVVERAIDFVLDLQTPRGEILWARHADGTPWSFALLTGSSSICHSLRCAIALAELLGHERPDWELSAARLAHVIANEPDAFAPKHRWAMDWYYPVLAGVLSHDAARARIDARWDTFVMEGRGVRCVSRPAVDHRGRDVRVLHGAAHLRRPRAGHLALLVDPAVPRRRRALLDRHRLPRRGALPRRRAVHLHGRLGRAGRRRARVPPPRPRRSSPTPSRCCRPWCSTASTTRSTRAPSATDDISPPMRRFGVSVLYRCRAVTDAAPLTNRLGSKSTRTGLPARGIAREPAKVTTTRGTDELLARAREAESEEGRVRPLHAQHAARAPARRLSVRPAGGTRSEPTARSSVKRPESSARR